jgi:hypothetical protein
MHAVVNADDELAAVKREIEECKEQLNRLEEGGPAWIALQQRLAALSQELAELRKQQTLLLQQAQGGCAETAARACTPQHSSIGSMVCLLCSLHEAWCARFRVQGRSCAAAAQWGATCHRITCRARSLLASELPHTWHGHQQQQLHQHHCAARCIIHVHVYLSWCVPAGTSAWTIPQGELALLLGGLRSCAAILQLPCRMWCWHSCSQRKGALRCCASIRASSSCWEL